MSNTSFSTPLIDPTMTLNELVALYPRTLPVLQRFGLDTCCGGALPLSTAAEHHALNLDQLIAALATVLSEANQ